MENFIKAVDAVLQVVVLSALFVYGGFIYINEININEQLKAETVVLTETIVDNQEDYSNMIMEIVKTIQITDSYLFVGGFNQEESAEFNLNRYEEMLTLKSDLDDLLANTENFFDDRIEYYGGLPNIWPIKLGTPTRVSSPYGDRYSPFTGKIYFHTGIDIVCPAGTEPIATVSGRIVGHWLNHPIYGKYVVIEAANGKRVHYAHLSKSYVYYGAYVEKGEPIGVIGNSGLSTGPHLHYAVSDNQVFEDPAGFFKPPESVVLLDENLTEKE